MDRTISQSSDWGLPSYLLRVTWEPRRKAFRGIERDGTSGSVLREFPREVVGVRVPDPRVSLSHYSESPRPSAIHERLRGLWLPNVVSVDSSREGLEVVTIVSTLTSLTV